MLKNQSKLYMFASACFFIAGSLEIKASQWSMAFVMITLGFSFFTLHFNSKEQKLDVTLIENDEIFNKFIIQGEKIKAVKRCRQVTNCGLKEAADYVEEKLA